MNLRTSMTENKSRNANASVLITDYATKTNLTNTSTKITNYTNSHNNYQMNTFNNI